MSVSSLILKLTDLIGALASPAAWRARYTAYLGRRFDRDHGTDTQQRIEVADLGIDEEVRHHAVHYEASSLPKLRRALNHLDVREEDYEFIDVGSGKGLVVIEAAKHAFRQVVGLEISTSAHRIAEKNVAAAMTHTSLIAPVRLVNINALDYDYAQAKQVVYLYNPFGEAIIRKLFSILSERRRVAERIIVVYVNPVWINVLEDEFSLNIRYRHKTLVVCELSAPHDQGKIDPNRPSASFTEARADR